MTIERVDCPDCAGVRFTDKDEGGAYCSTCGERAPMTDQQIIETPKVLAYCWTCNREYDVTRWSNRYGVKCDSPECDGYVMSPSGKIQSRIVGDFSKPLEPMLKVVRVMGPEI